MVIVRSLFVIGALVGSLSVQAVVPATVEVSIKKIGRASLRYDGVILPRDPIKIYSPEQAFLREEYVKAGDHVKKGQLVVKWSSPDLLNQHFQAKKESIECEEILKKLQNWDHTLPIISAKRDLSQSQLQIEEARYRLTQTQRLYDAGVVSKEEWQMDRRNHQQALRNYEQAKATMEQLKQKSTPAEIELAKMRLAIAKERQVFLENQIQALIFISPIEGIFIPPLDKQELLYGMIIDPLRWKVLIKVNERDAVILQKGQFVEIAIPALGKQGISGSIRQIDRQPIEAVEKGGLPRYEIAIAIHSALGALAEAIRVGMTAQTICYFPEKAGLVLPKQSIAKTGTVDRIDQQGRIVKTPVEIGEVLENEVFIVKGLQVGDKVVLPG